MLTLLRSTNLITSTEATMPDWEFELEYRQAFARFLAEIPSNFQMIATHRDKRDLVRKHLLTLYKFKPKAHEVETVLERVTNLALFVQQGREKIEDKASQSTFKSENWDNPGRCEICGVKFLSRNEVTIEHVIPLSLGGPDKKSNWQLACSLCNVQKDDFWGISDMSRLGSIRKVQGNFFGLPVQALMQQLRSKANPTRYWILERDGRQCTDCGASAKSEKLYVGPRNSNCLLTIENLTTYCADCRKKKKITYYSD
jgi:5-methylcytosine-specific restriction endonuclease McrA